MKNLLPAIVGLTLAGCATQAQIQYQHMLTQSQNTQEAFTACQKGVQSTEIWARLNRVFIIEANDPNAIRKMGIDRNATEQEKADLLEYRTSMQPCRQRALEGFSKVHQLYVSMLASWFAENDEHLLKLVKDEITVGEANRISEKRRGQRVKEATGIDSQIVQQLQAAHQYEVQNRAAAAAALQQWSFQQQLLQQNQQLINSLQRPAMTNCQFTGNQMHCTTY